MRAESCDVAWQGIPVCDADGISDGVITAHTDPWRVCQLLHQPVIASCYTRAHTPAHASIYHSQKLTRAQGNKKKKQSESDKKHPDYIYICISCYNIKYIKKYII